MTLISGDVHHSYLTAVDLPRRTGRDQHATATAARAAPRQRRLPGRLLAVPPGHAAEACAYAQRLASSRASGLIGTAAATLAGARVPGLRWRITEGPWFDNMIATLTYDGPKAIVRFDRAVDRTRTARACASPGNRPDLARTSTT